MNSNNETVVEEVCVKDNGWRDMDFSSYDAVFHVAGIAHSDTKAATVATKALYYQVNTELTIEVAKKAKLQGVRQFIFMSSIIVYGDSAPFGLTKRITKDSIPSPSNFYGNSKWQAELGLETLKDDDFKIAIIRPPMIYGKDSKGNYPRLARLAQKLPLFLDVDNERSMLHIDNLCEFVRLVVENVDDGIFYPQNESYVKTSELVVAIAAVHGKQMRLTKSFNPFLKLFARRVDLVNKVFGNLSYEMALSEYKDDYRVRDFKQSVELTEK
jgi:UDP-glucose 4-epimerase